MYNLQVQVYLGFLFFTFTSIQTDYVISPVFWKGQSYMYCLMAGLIIKLKLTDMYIVPVDSLGWIIRMPSSSLMNERLDKMPNRVKLRKTSNLQFALKKDSITTMYTLAMKGIALHGVSGSRHRCLCVCFRCHISIRSRESYNCLF